ncbi:MAG: hypothetical protein ACI4F5_02015, partial [Acutalibacteraceae bacterium]
MEIIMYKQFKLSDKKRILSAVFCVLCGLILFSAASTASAADTKTVRVSIYAMEKEYEKYISIPGSLKKSYTIPLSGKLSDYQYTVKGDSVNIS